MNFKPIHQMKLGAGFLPVLAFALGLPSLALAAHGDRCGNSFRVMSAAHELDVSSDRFHEAVHRLEGSSALANAAHDLAEAAEHLHGVVEMGADCDHIRDDFHQVEMAFSSVQNAWHYSSSWVRHAWEVRSALRNMEHAFYDLRTAVNSGFTPDPPTPGRTIELKCRSKGYRPAECGIGLAGSVLDVNLVRQSSDSPCIKGSTFGITGSRSAIWVSNGCSAWFSVLVR